MLAPGPSKDEMEGGEYAVKPHGAEVWPAMVTSHTRLAPVPGDDTQVMDDPSTGESMVTWQPVATYSTPVFPYVTLSTALKEGGPKPVPEISTCWPPFVSADTAPAPAQQARVQHPR